jgi:hypothetical protein
MATTQLTVSVIVRVVVRIPSDTLRVTVVVPARLARGVKRIDRLEPLLSGNVMPEFNRRFVFDDVALSVTLDAPVSTSPTVKLIVRLVLRVIEYDDDNPLTVGAVSTVIPCDADV